MYIKRTQ